MSDFLDLRYQSVGGGLAQTVQLCRATLLEDICDLRLDDWQESIADKDLLIATHGFNVDRGDGIYCLAHWAEQLDLGPNGVFCGLLWPGDSVWAHGLDYPDEPRVANAAGQQLAAFLDGAAAGARSISFASHSLGGRVVLETALRMRRTARRLILMAAAVDDNCLDAEFVQVAQRVERIAVLSSRKDEVLTLAFPLGNFFGGILAAGHPWWHGALGHSGPSDPAPTSFAPPNAIPDGWKFEHGDYLGVVVPHAPPLTVPTPLPTRNGALPMVDQHGQAIPGWQASFTAAFASTHFR